MFFVNLIYRLFDILMSQYGQIKKSCFFQGGLCHSSVTAPYCKDREPRYPQTHPSTIDFHEYHSNTHRHTPWTSLRHPQTSPGNSRSQQTKTEANRHKQTLVVLFGDIAGAVEISLLYDVSTDPRKSSYKSYLPTNFVESSFRRLCGIIIPQTLRNHHMKMINPLTASPLKPQYEIGTTDSGGDLSLSIIWRFYWSTALRS